MKRPRRSSKTKYGSPLALRRERRRRQQVSCARVVLLVVLVGALMANRGRLASLLGRSTARTTETRQSLFPLQMLVKTPVCSRYDLVPLILEARGPDGAAKALPEPPILRVLLDGQPVTTVGHVEKLQPRYDAKLGQYRAWWPIPWNARPGRYVVEARCNLEDPAQWPWGDAMLEPADKEETKSRLAEMVCRASFTIVQRKPAALPGGFCAVTWEQRIPTGRVRGPDSKQRDWRALLDWAEFMGADALWCRGAITQADKSWTLTMDRPFAPTDEEMMHRVAREAHRRGLRFGTWAVAYSTAPQESNAGKPSYKYAQVVRTDGSLADHCFISLLDEDRPGHLAGFLQRMAADPNIDMVGFDYFRPDRGGYEISDLFTRRMPVTLPEGFFDRSRGKRWQYVARKIEYDWRRDPDFYEQWNWYRAHLLSQRLKQIREQAAIDKPLWIFMFGWYHGQQIGQDPLMLTDAGADALAVMLYQIESLKHFELMTSQWREYKVNNCNLLPGNQLDFHWHQNMTKPRAAPEEFYRRIMVAHSSFQAGSVCLGTFWHDISRALEGQVGPYPGREWALAGAAAFSAIRRNWKVYPLTVDLSAPARVAVGSPFKVNVRLSSLATRPVTGLEISLEDTPQITAPEGSNRTVAELPAGTELTVPWTLKVRAHDERRSDRFMVAFRVRWAEGEYGERFRRDAPRTIVVMRYVDAF